MAMEVPASTDAGGDISPYKFKPQQTTLPLPAWIAQLWENPAAIALAVPVVPSTKVGAGGEIPQQATLPVPAWIAQLDRSAAAIAVAVPVVPSSDAGGDVWPDPQQTTFPVTAWIAQLWAPPVAMALAVPLEPLTDAGGDDWPSPSLPQQTTPPAWIAQL